MEVIVETKLIKCHIFGTDVSLRHVTVLAFGRLYCWSKNWNVQQNV